MRLTLRNWRDATFGIAIVSVAGAFLHQTTRIRRTPFDILGAAYFPRIVSIVLIVLGAVVLIRAIAGKATENSEVILFAGNPDNESMAARWPLALAMFVLTVAYTAAIGTFEVGFFVSTTAYLTICGWLIAGGGRANAIRACVFGPIAAGAITLLFKNLLGVDLS